MREAITAAKNIEAAIDDRPLKPFVFTTLGQLATIGRRTGVAMVFGFKFSGLIAWGMWVQAAGIAVTALATDFGSFALGAVLLGIGTAMVYPTLLATIGDVAHPVWRASAVGVYRLWRDLGYAVGALLAGVTADLFGLATAVWLVAALTLLSGVIAAVRMTETLVMERKL